MTLSIRYYETNIGKFFCIEPTNSYYSNQTLSGQAIVEIDGQDVTGLRPTSGFYQFQGELKDFKKLVPESKKKTGYKLKDQFSAVVSDAVPFLLTLDQLDRKYDSEEEEYIWIGSHRELSAMYEETFETVPKSLELVEVTITKIRELEVQSYSSPAEMKVKMKEGNYGGSTIEKELLQVVNFSEIEKMLTPEFLLHARPCSLTSQQVYKIVREYILSNIDGSVARVDSNYDFCFSVNKKVQARPVTTKTEQLTSRGKSYRPPKFTTKTTATKDVKIFEMTWQGAHNSKTGGYGEYPIIEGWQADSLQELYDNMKAYLDELMQEINKPVKECPNCNGCGMIVNKIGIERG